MFFQSLGFASACGCGNLGGPNEMGCTRHDYFLCQMMSAWPVVLQRFCSTFLSLMWGGMKVREEDWGHVKMQVEKCEKRTHENAKV